MSQGAALQACCELWGQIRDLGSCDHTARGRLRPGQAQTSPKEASPRACPASAAPHAAAGLLGAWWGLDAPWWHRPLPLTRMVPVGRDARAAFHLSLAGSHVRKNAGFLRDSPWQRNITHNFSHIGGSVNQRKNIEMCAAAVTPDSQVLKHANPAVGVWRLSLCQPTHSKCVPSPPALIWAPAGRLWKEAQAPRSLSKEAHAVHTPN